jgi:3-hydroxyisobutyrate dehydrogenase-like beta-hydroxyacid dehydrogenase
MSLRKVGLMTPGDMGQAVATQIKAQGFTVSTALDGRSVRSRALAREAGLTDVGTIARLVAECDVVLSIMNPGAAAAFAREAADALRASGRHTLIVDCNAVAPDAVQEIGGAIQDAGGRFLDACIIGPPPRGQAKMKLYVSGPGAAELSALAGPQLEVRAIGERIGDASALKMCSGALTKGTQLMWLEVLMAAQRLGIDNLLEEEVRGGSRAAIHEWVLRELPIMPPKVYRWVPEMLEVSRTMGTAGVTPKVFEGMAEICAFVSGTALGQERPEQSREQARGGREVIGLLARRDGGD